MAANNLVNTKMDIIAALVQRELRESASLLPFLRDYSNLAVKGSKQIELPQLSSFTVNDRAFGVAGTESAPLTDSTDVIALDKNKYIKFGYDAADAVQSTIDYLGEAIRRASSAHGRQINDDIITEWEAAAGLNLGAVADISIDDILNMREQLIANFADMSTARLVIAADQEKAMLKLPEFSRYDYRGDGQSPTVNGMLGSVYGVPVISNQQVKAGQAFMVVPEGAGFAFQRSPAVASDTDLDYGTMGKKVVVDCLYGVGATQLSGGVSPLIAKLIA